MPLSLISSTNGALTWVTLPLVHGGKHSETRGERVDGISSGKRFWTGEENDSFPSLWLLKDKKHRHRAKRKKKQTLYQMWQALFRSNCIWDPTVFKSAKYVWTFGQRVEKDACIYNILFNIMVTNVSEYGSFKLYIGVQRLQEIR